MTSEGLGEMFEGDSADMCAGKFPLMSMGGRAEGLACVDPGARTPIAVSGNFTFFSGSYTVSPALSYTWGTKFGNLSLGSKVLQGLIQIIGFN